MKTRVESPLRYETGDGRTIYALCIEVFPGFFGNVYVVDDGAHRYLVDCGSGWDACNRNLTAALESIETEFGARVGLGDLDAVLITHGHMDHFGGLGFVREHTDAPVGIHILDRPILNHYEERVIVASKQLQVFLRRCGLSENSRAGMMRMYTAPKSRFRSVPASFLLTEGEPVIATDGKDRSIDLNLEVTHVPGHCPGQVCLRLDDVMLTADHVLSRTTPHQSPESVTLHMGLGHYLESLGRLKNVEGVRLGLGGHEEAMDDVPARVGEIQAVHERRLEQILEVCSEPKTIADVSRELFGGLKAYNVLLGLEEAGAHVEYLHQRGDLVAANLEELEREEDPVVLYRQPS